MEPGPSKVYRLQRHGIVATENGYDDRWKRISDEHIVTKERLARGIPNRWGQASVLPPVATWPIEAGLDCGRHGAGCADRYSGGVEGK